MENAYKPGEQKLFIVDNDPAVSTGLKNYLMIRFGNMFDISTFNSGAEALLAVDQKTQIVILENYLLGETGTDIRHLIKKKNRLTRVIRLGANLETGDAIEFSGKGLQSPGRRLIAPVYKAITYPGRVFAREFNVSQFVGTFVISFVLIAVVTSLVIFFNR